MVFAMYVNKTLNLTRNFCAHLFINQEFRGEIKCFNSLKKLETRPIKCFNSLKKLETRPIKYYKAYNVLAG